MNIAGNQWVSLVLGVATYLASAKSHGRQMRLERELAGIWKVTFGGKNPDFVEALWSRERLIYWSIAVAFAVGSIVLLRGERRWIQLFLRVIVLPLSAAFTIAGLMSLIRFLLAASSAADSAWLSGAYWGSVLWWLITLAAWSAFYFQAFRRAAPPQ